MLAAAGVGGSVGGGVGRGVGVPAATGGAGLTVLAPRAVCVAVGDAAGGVPTGDGAAGRGGAVCGAAGCGVAGCGVAGCGAAGRGVTVVAGRGGAGDAGTVGGASGVAAVSDGLPAGWGLKNRSPATYPTTSEMMNNPMSVTVISNVFWRTNSHFRQWSMNSSGGVYARSSRYPRSRRSRARNS